MELLAHYEVGQDVSITSETLDKPRTLKQEKWPADVAFSEQFMRDKTSKQRSEQHLRFTTHSLDTTSTTMASASRFLPFPADFVPQTQEKINKIQMYNDLRLIKYLFSLSWPEMALL